MMWFISGEKSGKKYFTVRENQFGLITCIIKKTIHFWINSESYEFFLLFYSSEAKTGVTNFWSSEWESVEFSTSKTPSRRRITLLNLVIRNFYLNHFSNSKHLIIFLKHGLHSRVISNRERALEQSYDWSAARGYVVSSKASKCQFI